MDAPMVYPTAPFAAQAPQPNVETPTDHTSMGENVESPGKAKTVLSKVKHKAKKLRNKIKKVTGTNTSPTEPADNYDEHDKRDLKDMHSPNGKDVDDGEESYEDDEEDDVTKPGDNELKYEQLRSIGALDKQGDGSEAEVHGGVPVSVLMDSPGTYWKSSDDSAPISPYKSAGPPDALQATPTEYRNYAVDDDSLLKEKSTSSVPHGLSEEEISRGSDPLGSPHLPDVNPAQPHTKYDFFNAATAPSNMTAPHDKDGFTPKTSSGKSTPTDEIAGRNEGAYADKKREVGLHPEDYGGPQRETVTDLPETSVPEFKPDIQTADRSYETTEPHAKQGVSYSTSAFDTDIPFSEILMKPNPTYGKSSSPTHDKIAVMDEDLSADRRLGIGLSSEQTKNGEGNILDTSDHKPEPQYSKDGVSDTAILPDINVSYPEDLVKPNPSFGNSSSPTHDKIALMNEDQPSPDRKLRVGLSSEEPTESGKGNLLETAVPEFEELSGYKGGHSSVPLEADELTYRPVSDPEVGSSLTSLPGTLDGAVYKPNTTVQSAQTGQWPDDEDSSGKDPDYLPGTAGVGKARLKGEQEISPISADKYGHEWSPSFDVAEKPVDRGINSADDSNHETWGKWSADKINNAKDATVRGLIGTDHRSESQSQENSADNVADIASDTDAKVPNAQDVGAVAKPRALKDEDKDVEEAYYDPNEVKDNQFQDAFTHASPEEDALSGTLAGSAIEKLQGLKETMQSSLGYNVNHDDNGARREDKSAPEGEQVLSPASHQQQKGGFVQGLKETVASTLGYGKAPFDDEPGYNNDVSERGEQFENGAEKRQQQPAGTYQALKNVVASKLGYGPADESPTIAEETESHASPAETKFNKPPHSKDGDPENVIEEEHATDSVPATGGGGGSTEQPRGVLQGVKNLVTSKLGYGSLPEETYRDASHTDELEPPPAAIEQPSSYTHKLVNKIAAARDDLSSRAGYGNTSADDKQSKDYDDQEKLNNPSPESNIGSQLSPSDQNKVLSDLITDKVSSTANMIGEKFRLSKPHQSSNMPPPDQPEH